MILTLSLACLAAATSAPDAAPPLRLALIVAHNKSQDDDVKPLRFADDDGARFYELFQALGYRAALLTVLDPETAEQHPEAREAARPPSWERLARTVAELKGLAEEAHAAGREVELLVTYSGHGAVGRRGDPYVNLLDRRLYRGDFFREVVTAVGADFVHLVVDACRARDFVDARGGPDGPDFDRELSLFLTRERRSRHPEVGVVVAESADGETHEWSRTRSGIFAHEVLSALSGGADVDGDGAIEYSELHAFVAAANQAVRDVRARLRVVAEAPAQNPRRPLVSLAKSAAVQRLRTPRAGGRFTVEDGLGVRWLDVHLAPGQQATLHLPRRNRYFVADVARGSEASVFASEEAVALSDVSFTQASAPESRGSIAEALASDLFKTPYGPEFYKGFALAMRYPPVGAPPADPDVELLPVEPLPAPESPGSAAAVGAPAAVGSADAAPPEPQSFQPSGPPSALTPVTPPAVQESEGTVGPAFGWAALGSLAVALGAGALALDASKAAQRSGDRGDLSSMRDEQERAERFAVVSDIFLIGALASGVVFTVSWASD